MELAPRALAPASLASIDRGIAFCNQEADTTAGCVLAAMWADMSASLNELRAGAPNGSSVPLPGLLDS